MNEGKGDRQVGSEEDRRIKNKAKMDSTGFGEKYRVQYIITAM